MNLSHAYGAPVSAEQGERVLLSALDAGVTLFDTATLYGFGANATLVGRVLKPHRHKITLASKCGMQGVDVNGDGKLVRVIDGRPATLRKTCEDSLRRLQTDVIDLYYLHRWDKSVPIEESVGALGELVRKGLIRSIGLSEVSAATLRRAHAEHPVAAVQTEYSLWTRNAEIAVLDTCKALGVATPAQLAIAWLLQRGEHIIPIPGTTSLAHLAEDLEAIHVALDADTMATLDKLINPQTVTGQRYNAQNSTEVDTETY